MAGAKVNVFDATVTTGASGGTAEYRLDFKQIRKSDEYRALSNEAADEAMRFGLAGYATTAAICAELADAYADAALVWVFLEDIKDMAA